MTSKRLNAPWGSRLNRNRSLGFSFDGEPVHGFEGDTVASALLVNGRWLMSRSFKYHRPRGPLTMAGQDANTLVQLPSQPNALADEVLLESGLQVEAQNVAGSLTRDHMSWLGRFSRFLPVGFYYKTFFRPRGIWPYWAKWIRAQAGLGKLDVERGVEYSDKQYLFCHVAVIGGGPAGLAAALAAAQEGAEVILMEDNPVLGGSLEYARCSTEQLSQGQRLIDQVTSHPKISVLLGTRCNGWHADHWLAAVTPHRLFKIRAQRVVLASGMIEQPAIFRGNDIPGVVMGSAVQRMLRLYAVKPGKRAVVLAGNLDGYRVALDLCDAGVSVAAVVDLLPERSDPLIDAVKQQGIQVLHEHAVFEAKAKHNHLESVDVRPVIARGQCGPQATEIDCDVM